MTYADQILTTTRNNYWEAVREGVSKPIKTDNLLFLKNMQGLDYSYEQPEEFATNSILNVNMYLEKERVNKTTKTTEFVRKLKEAENIEDETQSPNYEPSKKLLNFV